MSNQTLREYLSSYWSYRAHHIKSDPNHTTWFSRSYGMDRYTSWHKSDTMLNNLVYIIAEIYVCNHNLIGQTTLSQIPAISHGLAGHMVWTIIPMV